MSVVGVLPQRFSTAIDAAIGRVGFVGPEGPVSRLLSGGGHVQWHAVEPGTSAPEQWLEIFVASPVSAIVYMPRAARLPDLEPDLVHAQAAFEACRRAAVAHVVVVSSVAFYGATPHHAGLASEHHPQPPATQPIARAWHALEAMAKGEMGAARVTVLRAAPTPVSGSRDFFSDLFTSSTAFPLVGHDPTLQFLSVADLARAIVCALERRVPGVFNIVPAAAVPLRAALREARCRAVPVPWTMQRPLRALLRRGANVASGSQLQFARYHLTASGDKAARELGFAARDTSVDAIRDIQPHPRGKVHDGRFDPFGLDRAYIDACWRGFMGVMHRRYWRIETRGLENIRRVGGGVLVGMHRGFMPFDGVMTLLSVVQATGRVPRFLIHPGVGLRFPFLFNLMSKLGGVIACQENADHVLDAGELLGVYPEGIRGAFTMYKRVHRIGPSWRNDCIVFALRHGVPVMPFVTVGSADIFPILGRIDWAWWKKLTEWPFIPLTPTFPFVPLPLPSKWHTLFLEPLHVEREYSPDAADNPAVVRAIGTEVKRRMEAAAADLAARRKSIFFGSVFTGQTQ